MVTYTQYIKNHRKTKIFKSSTPKFEGCPFKNATCVRVGTVKPKKPNSAQRKVAKVQLTNERFLIAYIPGFGHNLKKNSEVMVRGGRVPDLPGCRYHILRFKKDLNTPEVVKRNNRRSKYGIRHPSSGTKLTKRSEHRIAKRAQKKAKIDWNNKEFKSRSNFFKYQIRKLTQYYNA